MPLLYRLMAAKAWEDVTGGAGVVLVDGKPVELPKPATQAGKGDNHG
ncbi:MAG: hypothetical protein V4738_11065 [Pseudomonadota bacterium]